MARIKAFWESDDFLDDDMLDETVDGDVAEDYEEEVDNPLDAATAEEPVTLMDAGDQLSVEAIIEEAEEELSNYAAEMKEKHGDLTGAMVDNEFVSVPGDDGNIDVVDVDFDGVGSKDIDGTIDKIEEMFGVDDEDMENLDTSNLDEDDLAADDPEDVMSLGLEEDEESEEELDEEDDDLED